MKTINNDILSFIGEIIFKYDLAKDFIDDKNQKDEDILVKTINLFFNEKVIERKKRGEDPADFHPLSKLTIIIDDLINERIFYAELPFIIQEKLELPLKDACDISLMIENNKQIIEAIETENFQNEDSSETIEQKSVLKNRSIASEFLK
jgi:hypothetical protein